MRTFTFPVGWYVYRIDALTDVPFPVTSPGVASLVLPLAAGITATVVVATIVITILYRRKARVTLKIDDAEKES